VIEATIKIGTDDYDSFDGPCTLPALPPLGGHIAIIDKNANHRVLQVDDIVIHAASNRMIDELPNMSKTQLRVTVLCSEAFGHRMQF
jgi:hypothetical protein